MGLSVLVVTLKFVVALSSLETVHLLGLHDLGLVSKTAFGTLNLSWWSRELSIRCLAVGKGLFLCNNMAARLLNEGRAFAEDRIELVSHAGLS